MFLSKISIPTHNQQCVLFATGGKELTQLRIYFSTDETKACELIQDITEEEAKEIADASISVNVE